MKVVRLSAIRTGRLYYYSFLLEAESTPRPECGQKDYVNEKFQWHYRESTRDLPVCSSLPQPLRYRVSPTSTCSGSKPLIVSGIEPGTFWLVAHCPNQPRHSVSPLVKESVISLQRLRKLRQQIIRPRFEPSVSPIQVWSVYDQPVRFKLILYPHFY
jgi:hypothetical protein